MSENKSILEKVANHPATQVAMTIAAISNPTIAAAALLPVLTSALGFMQLEERINKCLTEINEGMRLQRDHLSRFSEAQWRLTIGIIQTAQSTVDQEKLRMLKAAALNVAGSDYIEHFEAQAFTRILRDASAADIAFLIRHRGVVEFSFQSPPGQTPRDGLVYLGQDGPDAVIARNLTALGILARSWETGTASDVGAYKVAEFVPRLLQLIEDTPLT